MKRGAITIRNAHSMSIQSYLCIMLPNEMRERLNRRMQLDDEREYGRK